MGKESVDTPEFGQKKPSRDSKPSADVPQFGQKESQNVVNDGDQENSVDTQPFGQPKKTEPETAEGN